jgi:ATP-binding cassette subfamily B protein
MTATSPASDILLYRRLAREVRPYWRLGAATLFLSLLSIPLALSTPLPLKIAIDSVLGSKPVPGLFAWALPEKVLISPESVLVVVTALFLAISLLHQLQLMCTAWLRTYVGEKLVLGFRTKLFNQAQRLSVTYHDAKGAADSSFRIQWDAPHIRYLVLEAAIPFVTACVMLVGMICVTFYINRQLALIALAISPVILLISQAYRVHLRNLARRLTTLESSTASVVQEVLGALRVVKAFGRERFEEARFGRHATDGFDARIDYDANESTFSFVIGMSLAAGTAIVLYVGVRQVQSQTITLGELLLVMSYLLQLYEPLRSISEIIGRLQLHLASAERAFAFLDEMPDVSEKRYAHRIERAEGHVIFEDVSFVYPGGRVALQHASFEVGPGARVGIMGPTGAGKTTLISLLARFYDPTAGRILLDRYDLRDYNLADLRAQFAIVLQEPVLFSTTIADNIAYGRPGASGEQIVKAAKAAHVHEFIARLPDGYETRVGERGMSLSGGERQRIALARALLKQAPILILDEPTSSVDVETESMIIDSLEELNIQRTTFIIAHRLTTLRNCTEVFEIEKNVLRKLTIHEIAQFRPRPSG